MQSRVTDEGRTAQEGEVHPAREGAQDGDPLRVRPHLVVSEGDEHPMTVEHPGHGIDGDVRVVGDIEAVLLGEFDDGVLVAEEVGRAVPLGVGPVE